MNDTIFDLFVQWIRKWTCLWCGHEWTAVETPEAGTAAWELTARQWPAVDRWVGADGEIVFCERCFKAYEPSCGMVVYE